MSVLSTQNSSAYGPLTRNRPSPPPLCPLRPSIILIHGGWQGPETYALLTPRLEKAGYSVFAPSLPSSGAEHAEPNFSGDVSVVRNAVLSTLKMGKDVVLIMHSYGAVVGCEALKDVMSDAELCELRAGGLKVGEVVRLGFVSGMVLPVGEATWNASHGYRPVPGFECVVCVFLRPSYSSLISSPLPQNNLIAVLDGSQRFYGDLPQEEARRWAERLKKQSRLYGFLPGRRFLAPCPSNLA